MHGHRSDSPAQQEASHYLGLAQAAAWPSCIGTALADFHWSRLLVQLSGRLLCKTTRGVGRVGEDAAQTAHLLLGRVRLARGAITRRPVLAAWLRALAIALDLDVAAFAPAGAPTVAHQPIVLAVLLAIADQHNGVIDGRAARGIVDALLIEAPRRVDRDGDRADRGHSVHQSAVVVSGQPREARDAADGCEGAHPARSITRLVGVVCGGDHATADRVVEREPLCRAFAAAGATAIERVGGAVHKLLWRVLDHAVPRLDGDVRLEHLRGREGPARTATALVLRLRHDALLAPVDT
mmetsp:Transcript_32425/g.75623  ORF Transcript_32425/g.75623 Transcript_32425/m.75623 type:complete len:295 (+) Transcript_32425:111-995(+)